MSSKCFYTLIASAAVFAVGCAEQTGVNETMGPGVETERQAGTDTETDPLVVTERQSQPGQQQAGAPTAEVTPPAGQATDQQQARSQQEVTEQEADTIPRTARREGGQAGTAGPNSAAENAGQQASGQTGQAQQQQGQQQQGQQQADQAGAEAEDGDVTEIEP